MNGNDEVGRYDLHVVKLPEKIMNFSLRKQEKGQRITSKSGCRIHNS